MQSKRSQRGASLVDVIATITVLAIIGFAAFMFLMPSLRPHPEQSNRAQCLYNLKQIGLGLALYENEFEVMPPKGPKSLLYADGSGYVTDPEIFNCLSAENHHPMGDYLRDVNWDIKVKPNIVIAGDAPENHEYGAYMFLFKDGHATNHKGTGNPPTIDPVKNVKGAYFKDDGMYSGTGDSDSTRSTWLKIRD